MGTWEANGGSRGILQAGGGGYARRSIAEAPPTVPANQQWGSTARKSLLAKAADCSLGGVEPEQRGVRPPGGCGRERLLTSSDGGGGDASSGGEVGSGD